MKNWRGQAKDSSSSRFSCKQYFAFIFSNVEVYNNNQQIHISNGLYSHKSYISNNFKGAISEYKVVLHCERYDYEEIMDEIMDLPLSQPFFNKEIENA